MNSEGNVVVEKAVRVQVRRQGPWLIMRFWHPDGYRFFDQLAGRIPSENKQATMEHGRQRGYRPCSDNRQIRR